MPQPAARLTDLHTCPMIDPVTATPHVGGPITAPGCPTVLIGGLPAARISDVVTCVGTVPDAVLGCNPIVLVGGLPIARMGDATAHGGVIVLGCFNVLA